MKRRNISTITPKVRVVMSIPIESVVPNLRNLMVALYLSDPGEEVRIRELYADDNIVHHALNTVNKLRNDKELRDVFIDGGFFDEQLELLLDIAKKRVLAGSRLVPVFCQALREAEELKISAELQEKIIAHIEWQRDKDGFAISELSEENNHIVPADDVEPL